MKKNVSRYLEGDKKTAMEASLLLATSEALGVKPDTMVDVFVMESGTKEKYVISP